MEGLKRDALGNAVLWGKTYGYSMDKNGFLKVILGKAIKATKTGVTLEVIDAKRALYDDDLAPLDDHAAKVNVKSGKLFPVNI